MHTIPMTRDHIPALATLAAAAFEHDIVFDFLAPNHQQHAYHFRVYFLDMLRERLCLTSVVTRVAVSDDSDSWWDDRTGEQVLGIACWNRLSGTEGEATDCNRDGDSGDSIWGWQRGTGWQGFRMGTQIGYSDVFRLNPLRNPALLAAARSCDPEYWRVARDYTDAARGHVWLALLAVDPVYQGRGVGLRLLRWGCERADRMGLQVALVAAPTAVGMYDREGFEEVTKVRLGPCFDLAMVRRAKTRME